MAGVDPQAALLRIVEVFCDFWSFDPRTLGLLHAAGASDPEIKASVHERLERRRRVLSVLVRRVAKAPANAKALGDLVDVLFALTSFEFFSQLTAPGRSDKAACKLIQDLAMDALRRYSGG